MCPWVLSEGDIIYVAVKSNIVKFMITNVVETSQEKKELERACVTVELKLPVS